MPLLKRYCPRCDRAYKTAELMQEHLEKHHDFDPLLFGDKPYQDKADLNEWPEAKPPNR